MYCPVLFLLFSYYLINQHIIKLFTQENQTILDTFAGSGSHGVAALKCNRKFIGIEIEPKYYDICKKRLSKINNNDKMINLNVFDKPEQLSKFIV